MVVEGDGEKKRERGKEERRLKEEWDEKER